MKKLLSVIILTAMLAMSFPFGIFAENTTSSEVGAITEYRSRVKEFTTDNSPTKDGWTLMNSTDVWSDWSGWSTNAVSSSNTREVETRQVADPQQYKTVHRYNRWTYLSVDNLWYSSYAQYTGSNYKSSGRWEYIELDYPLEVKGYIDSRPHYGDYKLSPYGNYDLWWNYSTASVALPLTYHTEYHYRDKTTTYTFFRWTDWSSWSTNPITADENTQVETRVITMTATPTPTPTDTPTPMPTDTPTPTPTPTPTDTPTYTPTPTPTNTPTPNTVKVNFQPSGVEIPTGYIPDCGELYGARNGHKYGWNTGYTGATRDRNINTDQRLDTLIMMYSQGKWEMEIQNGTYEVTVSVGDPQFTCTPTVNVEGVNYWSGPSLAPNQYLQQTKTVTVSDGRLTIDNGGTADLITKLNYVEIVEHGIPSPLQIPGSLQTSTTAETVTMMWGAVANATGYEVEADGRLYTAVTPEFIHNWLEPNTAHSYRVRAVNGTARSEWSNTVTATTLPEAPGTIKINFQPQGTEIPAGYLPDYGEVYGQRNGFIYGWNAGYTGAARDRGINTNQKLDTLIMMYRQGKWEMQVENGVYDVTICVGDEQFDCTPTVNVEGVNCCTGVSLSPGQHLQVTRTVTVSDGRITVDNGETEDLITKLNYIKIVRVNVGP